jgi:hypothetical protein
MKLILLLIAIYSLIFYQHYKIQKAKASPPESESKAINTKQDPGLTDQQDYKTANFLIRSSISKFQERPISGAGFYQ